MNMHVAKRRRRYFRIAKAAIEGAGSLLVVSTPRHTHLTKKDAVSALRGDFARIGNDMKIAVRKEREREEARR